MADILDDPIKFQPLGVRILNCCANNNVQTLRELLQLTESELLRWPNFGRKSIYEINQFLELHGIDGIRATRPRYFTVTLPAGVHKQLAIQANANGRTVESEASAILLKSIGPGVPEHSLAERVSYLERLVAEIAANKRERGLV